MSENIANLTTTSPNVNDAINNVIDRVIAANTIRLKKMALQNDEYVIVNAKGNAYYVREVPMKITKCEDNSLPNTVSLQVAMRIIHKSKETSLRFKKASQWAQEEINLMEKAAADFKQQQQQAKQTVEGLKQSTGDLG